MAKLEGDALPGLQLNRGAALVDCETEAKLPGFVTSSDVHDVLQRNVAVLPLKNHEELIVTSLQLALHVVQCAIALHDIKVTAAPHRLSEHLEHLLHFLWIVLHRSHRRAIQRLLTDAGLHAAEAASVIVVQQRGRLTRLARRRGRLRHLLPSLALHRADEPNEQGEVVRHYGMAQMEGDAISTCQLQDDHVGVKLELQIQHYRLHASVDVCDLRQRQALRFRWGPDHNGRQVFFQLAGHCMEGATSLRLKVEFTASDEILYKVLQSRLNARRILGPLAGLRHNRGAHGEVAPHGAHVVVVVRRRGGLREAEIRGPVVVQRSLVDRRTNFGRWQVLALLSSGKPIACLS
mmetsp:Transcript_4226/g.15798  ORF Transcript_4226/g.15798 Transcript_4226/m.15798 type:complete len:349 (-) Transcript_4226:613-1659(-)